jgi:hypothetical protein
MEIITTVMGLALMCAVYRNDQLRSRPGEAPEGIPVPPKRKKRRVVQSYVRYS